MKTRTYRFAKCGAVVALGVASVFASSAIAMASPVSHTSIPTNLTVQGTVTVLTTSSGIATSVTIQPANPARPSENVLLSANTIYFQGGATVSVSALVVGEPVQMVLTGTPATAAIVRIMSPEPVFVNGTITALTPSSGTATSITVQPRDPAKPTVTVAVGAGTLYYAGGVAANVTALIVGAQVELEATGSPATATVVEVEVPRPMVITGVITAMSASGVTPASLTVLPSNRHAVAVNIDLGASTVYLQAGATVTLANLMVGSHVQIVATGNPAAATVVRIAVPRPVELNGMVTELNPSSGVPTSVTVQPNGFFVTPVTVAIGANTKFWQRGDNTTVTSLLVGSRVQLTASGNPLTATVVRISAPVAAVTIGSVTAVTNSTVTVQPVAAGSATITFNLTNATTYFSGRDISTIAEINVGDIVRVAAATSSPTTALSVSVRNSVIVGRVSGVVGNVISVTGLYGDVLTVNVTGSTRFVAGAKTSALASVLPGDLISAIGPAMTGVSDSVTATTVWIGTRDNPIFHDAWLQYHKYHTRHHR